MRPRRESCYVTLVVGDGIILICAVIIYTLFLEEMEKERGEKYIDKWRVRKRWGQELKVVGLLMFGVKGGS